MRVHVLATERHISRLIRAHLERAGHTVDTSATAEGALASVRASRPDMILWDDRALLSSGEDPLSDVALTGVDVRCFRPPASL